MEERILIAEIVKAYDEYVALAESLGFKVVKSAIRRKALENTEYRGDMKALFSSQYVKRHPQRSAPVAVFHNMKKLCDEMASIIRHRLNGEFPANAELTAENILKALEHTARRKAADIASDLAASEHVEFLRAREVPIEEFHKVMDEYAGNQTVARSKIIAHFKDEMKKLGVKMSSASIEERMRRNTKVKSIHPAMIEVARKLDDSFKTGLVPIEAVTGGRDPNEWLEESRGKLGFRSKNAMHKAIAEETGLNYETIHKALTNPKPGQRLRVEIREYINGWLAKAEHGEYPPTAKASHRASSSSKPGSRNELVGKAREMLKKLASTYPSRRVMLSDAASVTGLSVSALRSIASGRGGAGLDEKALHALDEMQKNRKNRPTSSSYLRDRQVRRRATSIAEKVERAKEAWLADRENLYLRDRFRRLRLELIITIREGYIPDEWDIKADDYVEDYEYIDAF